MTIVIVTVTFGAGCGEALIYRRLLYRCHGAALRTDVVTPAQSPRHAGQNSFQAADADAGKGHSWAGVDAAASPVPTRNGHRTRP